MKDVTPPHIELSASQPPATSARAAALSSTLRKMAAKARGRKRIWTPSYVPARRWEHSFNAYVLRAFIAIVVVPVAVAGLYLAFFVSDQYMSETRFAVRGAERASFDPIGNLLGVPSSNRVQEAMIISDYLRGRGIVEELEKEMNLRQRFAGPSIDILSRFNTSNAIEELIKYWRWHIDVSIDALSGIVTVEVFAFTPQDALEISQAILAASERLINELSDRSRRDALQQTQTELKRAEAGLQASIRALQDLRNAEGLLDVDKTSETMIQMLADMRLEVIRMDREYAAQRQTVAPDSPQLRVLESRIKATRDQIGKLESQMTGSRQQKEGPALAESMSRFERLKLEHDIAQKRYIAAAGAFEKARVDLSTQQVYLTTFVPPTLAQKALYPRRLWIFIIIVVGCLALWGLGTGAAVLMRNHMG
jgi:capsular polysaccharide transport system permease protein